jgi:lysyl-tRNA synthetase class 2
MNEKELEITAKKLNVEIDETMGEGKIIDAIFGEKCEHNYINPTLCLIYVLQKRNKYFFVYS